MKLKVLVNSLIGSSLLLGLLANFYFLDRQPVDLRVGTISGPETQLVKLVQQIAWEKHQLRIKIVEFSDYHFPNKALHEGRLDANIFQHQAYLEQEKQHNPYRFSVIGKTFTYPMGVYSKRFKTIKQLKENAVVAIPNDPTNEGRALLLLEKAGCIQLDPNAGFLATPRSIRHNPKKLKFKEIEAAQLVRTLPDVDIAVINTNYAVSAGLYPTRDALFAEDKDSPYANLIVVNEKDKEHKNLHILVKLFEDDRVIHLAKVLFKSQAIPAMHGGEGGIRTRGRF